MCNPTNLIFKELNVDCLGILYRNSLLLSYININIQCIDLNMIIQKDKNIKFNIIIF